MAERDQPGISHQHVERDRGDREDHDARAQTDEIAAPFEHRRQWQEREYEENADRQRLHQATGSRGRRRCCERRQRRHSAALRREEAGRPHIEHDRHQEIDQHRGDGGTRSGGRGRVQHLAQQIGQEGAAHGVDEADHDRRDEGAADRADATDHDHDEGQNENGVAHARLDREDGRDHDAGKAREHGAEAEHDHEQALDVHAERGDHPGIRGAGPHQHADAGVVDEHVEERRDREPRRDHDQPPHRIIEPLGQPHRA